MTIEALSPGVYVSYTDKSIYAATSVPLTLLLIGTSHKGTTDPIFITNSDDFIAEFGTQTTDSYLHYAALSYLKSGRFLWVKRVATINAAAGSVNLPNSTPANSVQVETNSSTDLYNGYKVDVQQDTTIDLLQKKTSVNTIQFTGSVQQPTNVTGVALSNPTGASGSYSLVYTFSGQTLTWGGGTPVAVGAGGTFTLTNLGATSTVSATVTAGSLPGVDQTDATIAVTLSVSDPSPLLPGLFLTAPVGNIGQHTITYTYTSDTNIVIKLDSGSNSISIHNQTSVAITDGGNSLTVKITRYGFKILFKDPSGNIIETLDKLVKDPNHANFHVTRVPSLSSYLVTTDYPATALNPATTTTSLLIAGGNAGMSGITDADYITTLDLFTNTEEYDINFVSIPAQSSANVVNALITFCEGRGDCMAIIDPPAGLSAEEVVQWSNGEGAYSGYAAFNSMFAFVLHDWLKFYDPVNDTQLYLPPSVSYLNLLAISYVNGKQYQPIAGYDRGKIIDALDVQTSPSLAERDLMYSDSVGNNINPIVKFVRDGLILFGEKTLQRKNSSTNRIHAVITLLYLFKQVNQLAKRVLFEVNDATTWRSLTALIEPILDDLKSPSKRALYDARFVCDSSTNTPELIDQNKLAAKLYVKFAKSAEIITVDIIATNTGADFSVL